MTTQGAEAERHDANERGNSVVMITVADLKDAALALVSIDTAAAVAFGTAAAMALAPAARRTGVPTGALLVLALPWAELLEPTAGVVLLVAMLAATTRPDDNELRVATMERAELAVAVVMLLGVLLLYAVGPLSRFLGGFADLGRWAFWIAGAGLAALAFGAGHRTATALAAGLVGGGLGLQLSPYAPFDGVEHTAVPVLLGLLLLGPMLATLLRLLLRSSTASGWPRGETLVITLLAFPWGVPVTLGAALVALALADAGLRLGPGLITDRPALLLGAIVAVAVAVAAALLLRALFHRVGRFMREHGANSHWRTSAAMVVLLGISALTFWRAGLDRDGIFTGLDTISVAALLGGTVFGGLVKWFGIDPSPAAIGLVIGQLLKSEAAPVRDGLVAPITKTAFAVLIPG